ncbi:hypothetical protein YC2023_016756 [Brassica napus]
MSRFKIQDPTFWFSVSRGGRTMPPLSPTNLKFQIPKTLPYSSTLNLKSRLANPKIINNLKFQIPKTLPYSSSLNLKSRLANPKIINLRYHFDLGECIQLRVLGDLYQNDKSTMSNNKNVDDAGAGADDGCGTYN